MLTLAEGKIAVNLARDAITSFIEKRVKIRPNDLPPVFSEKHGVFVTLHKNGELRGCIGYPLPILPLGVAIVDSAMNACSCDPRFLCVEPNELKHIELEVTILTKPVLYNIPKTLMPGTIRIGKDGLIVSKGSYSGLLLPQVAPEWSFDALEFLSHTCMKAGLPPDAWLDEDTEVQHFEAQIFSEVAGSSEIIEKKYYDGTCEI